MKEMHCTDSLFGIPRYSDEAAVRHHQRGDPQERLWGDGGWAGTGSQEALPWCRGEAGQVPQEIREPGIQHGGLYAEW